MWDVIQIVIGILVQNFDVSSKCRIHKPTSFFQEYILSAPRNIFFINIVIDTNIKGLTQWSE